MHQEFRFKACHHLRILYEQGVIEIEDNVIAELYSEDFYSDKEIFFTCLHKLYEEKMTLKDAEKILNHIINNPKSDLHKKCIKNILLLISKRR